ncbi:PREDICTED: nucleolar transcription factor 1-like, partial [Rhagoletis zephyria]|uniref:nucleolar transcription factor 1-like n=1 Tax=Rhagoletis zephyria TaxID=28612 RepID=UPI00081186D1
NVDLREWEIPELRVLVKSVEREAPVNETCRFRTSLDKVDWTAVAAGMGGGRSGEECKRALNSIIQQVRTHRTLSEILADAKVVAENPFRNKRTGRINHPDQPKKPPTPYFLFFSEKRAKYQAVNPGMSPSELSSFMAAEFKVLSEKKRAKYRKKYDKAMEEYRQKYAEFRRRHPDLFKRNRKPAATPNDLGEVSGDGAKGGPESNMDLLECPLREAAHEVDQEGGDGPRALRGGDEHVLCEAPQLPASAAHAKERLRTDQERYEEEMSTYCAKHPNYLRPPPTRKNVSVLTREEQRLKNRFDGVPERPSTSGYAFFTQQMMEMTEMTKVPPTEKLKIVGQLWRELSEDERAKYNAEFEKDQAQVVECFDAYLKGLPEEKREKVFSEQRLKSLSKPRKMTKAQQAQLLSSAYTYYQTEELMRIQREQPSKMKGELIPDINRRWEAMTSSERQVYVDLAESIKKFLPAEKPGTSVYLERSRKKAAVNLKEVEFVEKSGLRRPPKNGFVLYKSECGSNPEFASLLPTEKTKQMAAVWKVTFAEHQRQYYVKRCREIRDAFSALVRKYEETSQLPTPEEAAAVHWGKAVPNSDNAGANKKPVQNKSSQKPQNKQK